jgi:hypothetical protein
MAFEAAVLMRRRSANFIKARRTYRLFTPQAGYMTASVLARVSVRLSLDTVGGSIYVANFI